MQQFTGEITQIPPMYSAVKVNGKRLYEYARNGETVERPKRKAQIDLFERTTEPIWNEVEKTQSWRFRVVCGKGTYVRTLAVDTGKAIGVPAHMSDLTRTASGGFTKEQAVTLAQVAEAMENESIEQILLPIEFGVKDFQRIDITEELWNKVKNGMRLPYQEFGFTDLPKEPFAVFYHAKVVCLYQPHEKQKGIVKPLKVLQTE
jgi:tRNA pseudouridine55 synthase